MVEPKKVSKRKRIRLYLQRTPTGIATGRSKNNTRLHGREIQQEITDNTMRLKNAISTSRTVLTVTNLCEDTIHKNWLYETL